MKLSVSPWRRSARTPRLMPRRDWKSSKRRTFMKHSRRMRMVQRSPITDMVRASEQISWSSSFHRIEISSHRAASLIAPSGSNSILLYRGLRRDGRSEEHTSELQSLMRISYAVFCLKKKKQKDPVTSPHQYKSTQ